jgi:mono/diheme cytochrome c family protein
MDSEWALALLDHPDAPIRSWTVRLLKDAGSIALRQRLVGLARSEPDAEVRSELASMAARLEVEAALAVLRELIRRQEDVSDKHIPLRLWWALENKISRDADAVVSWLEKAGIWQEPVFTEALAGRIARRLAAERGDSPSFTRIDPTRNWKEYAQHPRSQLPGGKGDYTGWETNYTPDISDRNLMRLARLLERAPIAQRSRLLAGVKAGLEQGAAPERVPVRLSALIDGWWSDGPQTGALLDVAARLRHPEAVKKAIDAAGAPGSSRPTPGLTAGPVTYERGREAYLIHCAPCHQTDGTGMARLAAPLRDSRWVLGREDLLARIVLNGLKGELLMPPMGTLDDAQLAAILTYVRGAWGHEAGAISQETLAAVRARSQGRQAPWTAAELSALQGPD